MLTVFTGAPGAGKTAALVKLLSELPKDRPLYVANLEGLTLDHTPLTLEEARNWPKTVPDGAIFVIDEVQHLWRVRPPGSKVPEDVSAIETHRHRGIDIYCTTQHPRLVDANVRALIGRHVHIRDTGWLGRMWYEWPECNEAMAWKTCPVKMKYKLPAKVFSLYKSSSMHTKPVRRTPPALWYSIGAIVLAVVMIGMVIRTISSKTDKAQAAAAPTSSGTMAALTGAPASTATAPAAETFIDDRIAWIPRVSSRPESAPAFDQVRKVSAMPVIVGCVSFMGQTKCFTQQGTDAGLDNREAADLLAQRRFNPYAVETPTQAQGTAGAQNALQRPENGLGGQQGAPTLIAIDGPGWRDPLGASRPAGGTAPRQ